MLVLALSFTPAFCCRGISGVGSASKMARAGKQDWVHEKNQVWIHFLNFLVTVLKFGMLQKINFCYHVYSTLMTGHHGCSNWMRFWASLSHFYRQALEPLPQAFPHEVSDKPWNFYCLWKASLAIVQQQALTFCERSSCSSLVNLISLPALWKESGLWNQWTLDRLRAQSHKMMTYQVLKSSVRHLTSPAFYFAFIFLLSLTVPFSLWSKCNVCIGILPRRPQKGCSGAALIWAGHVQNPQHHITQWPPPF